MARYVNLVDPSNFAVPYAKERNTGKIIHLKNWNGQRDGLVCGQCEAAVIYRKGNESRSPNFAHKAGEITDCGMTLTHRIFRDATVEIINETGRTTGLFNQNPWGTFDPIGTATSETCVPGTKRIADVLFLPANPGFGAMALEIVVTSGVRRDKVAEIERAKAGIAGLNVSKDPKRFENCETERDMIELAKAHIRGSRGFRLLFTSKAYQPNLVEFKVEIPNSPTFACEPVRKPVPALQRPLAPFAASVPPVAVPEPPVALVGAPELIVAPVALDRQHALRQWHTRPDLYPDGFAAHWERGDFTEKT